MAEIERVEPGQRLSHAVIHANVVYVSGVASPGASVREQTKNLLQGVDKELQRAGTDKSKILTAMIVMTDIRKIDEMNSVWEKWLVPGCAPVRVCVETKVALPGFFVEIAVTAAR
jgi:enamine deaminase RidA (YjgF/YER057c/UK114 family)